MGSASADWKEAVTVDHKLEAKKLEVRSDEKKSLRIGKEKEVGEAW